MKRNKNIFLTAFLCGLLIFLTEFIVLAQAQPDPVKNEPDKTSSTVINNDSETDEIMPVFSAEDDMKPLKALRSPYSISYGGWLTSVFMNDSSSKTMASTSIGKAWFKSTLPYNFEFYFRLTDVFNLYLDSPYDDKTNNEFDIDIASLSVTNNSRTLKFELGRKFFALGTGLVFSGRGDGAEFDFFSKYADIKLFGIYTGLLNDDTNTSRLLSAEGFDEGKRIFAGGSLSKNIKNQTLYLMGLYQMDKNKETAIKTKYNSQHYGAGMKGVLGNAFYFSELVLEQGTSYTSQQEEQDIMAVAALFGINYYFDVSVKPALMFNYAFGSGDADRQNAVSATGNTSGGDNGFIYFGNYTGGYTLRPYLSNMHVFRLGFSLLPLNNSAKKYLKRINLIVNYSNYLKHRTDSTINSTGEAQGTGRLIGHGIDTALKWQIFSDLSVFGNFGLFIPGSAYDADEGTTTDTRSFVMAGLNLSF